MVPTFGLKNISIGYNLPLAKMKINWMKGLKIYVSARISSL